MATKKPAAKPHFHIPADPLRVKVEELQHQFASRKQQNLKSTEVTLDTLYEMLNDVLEQQALLLTAIQRSQK
ncbi:hypothetical protein [Paenibacillus rubinfantis]|uniref:hypothetical protein n=1 Tax=Paenibacillus rubinfantis TaxID=1720296 RepID=UPI00073E8B92|nr:hypothetical protein [Paenibacillus rubinfantis]